VPVVSAVTAPVRAAYVTADLVQRFASYLSRNGAWGCFHVYLDDGNYDSLTSIEEHERICGALNDEERGLMEVFVKLTPSQRRKLGAAAQKIEMGQWAARFK
jgi:hypothetical protein